MASIDSNDMTLSEVFLHDFYSVPNYQREYVWDTEQVQQLLDDISVERAGDDAAEYFVGSIVTAPGAGQKLDLIDGQQRITTFFVLFCAIRDRLAELGGSSTTIRRMIADQTANAKGVDCYEPRLDPQYEDAGDIFKNLVAEQRPIKGQGTRSMQNVANAYYLSMEFLVDECGESADELLAFFGYLYNKVKLIRIDTDSVARALKIFETINDRGVGLDAMDLLKNLLFIKAAPSQFEKLKDDWKRLTDTLYKNKEKPLRFLRYYIFATYGLTKGKDGEWSVTKVKEDQLYKWLTDNEDLVGFGRDPIGFVARLNDALAAYLHFLGGRDAAGVPRPYTEALTRLAGRSTRQHLILLLAGRHLPQDVFAALCRDAEQLVFVYIVTHQLTRDFEVLFPEWAQTLKSISSMEEYAAFAEKTFKKKKLELSARFHREFASLDCQSMKGPHVRYLLAKLTQFVDLAAFGQESEGHRWLGRYADGGSNQIEHILAQTTTDPIRVEFGDGADDPGTIWSIGNLALVERTINASLGNSTYAHKKTIYPQSQLLLTRCISKRPEIGKTGKTAIDRAVARLSEFDQWNKEAVKARAHMLDALAAEIWDIPYPEEAKQTEHGAVASASIEQLDG